MAYTFGGATGDDITIASHLNSNSGGILVMGWWRPTTLTAGRTYWAASSLTNIKVGPTTSELRIAIDRATTDDQVDSSGAGITVDEWHFIALLRVSSGGNSELRLWVGHGLNPPAEVGGSFTVSGSGAETASSSSVVGNVSAAGTLAFQGQIEQVLDMRWANSPLAPLSNETAGIITQAEADYFFQTCVWPYWYGNPQPQWVRGTNTACYVYDLGTNGAQHDIYQRGSAQRLGPLALTVNGAVISAERCPRPILQAYPTQQQYIARRM